MGLEDDDIDGQAREMPWKSDKVSLQFPNAANLVDDWLRKNWKELYSVPYAWFTGSSVWRFLYDEPKREGADLDVFITPYRVRRDELPTCEPCAKLEKALAPLLDGGPLSINNVDTGDDKSLYRKEFTSLGGKIAWTTKGRVDYWACGTGGIEGAIYQLRNYPDESHGHCKAAYSPFWRMLLVLPNIKATEQGEIELLERTGMERLEKAARLQLEARTNEADRDPSASLRGDKEGTD